jgi:hypothetical protein
MLALCGSVLTVGTLIEIVWHAMTEASVLVMAIRVAFGCLLLGLTTDLMHINHPMAQPQPSCSVGPSPGSSKARTSD